MTIDNCLGQSSKKLVKLWSPLTRSLLNLYKSFFHNWKGMAFSFRLNTNQTKITGQGRIIFSPGKKNPLITDLSRGAINVANKMH